MAQRLEAIKGGGGSIKVGTTGTISSLMTRELESVNPGPQTPVSSANKAHTIPVSVHCGDVAATKSLQSRKSSDEASSSGINHRSNEIAKKIKGYTGNTTHRIPMLGAGDIVLDRTPVREKTDKIGSNIVEIVDIKCGNPDRVWTSPLKIRLKKLGFSKLSGSID